MISSITSPAGVTLSLGTEIAYSEYFLTSSMPLRTSMPSSVSHCIIILNKTSQSMKHTGLIPQFPIPTTYNNYRGSEAGAHNSNFKLFVITYASHYLFAPRPGPTAGEGLPHRRTTAHLMSSCLSRVCHSLLVTLRSQHGRSLWQHCALQRAFIASPSPSYHSKACGIHWLDLLIEFIAHRHFCLLPKYASTVRSKLHDQHNNFCRYARDLMGLGENSLPFLVRRSGWSGNPGNTLTLAISGFEDSNTVREICSWLHMVCWHNPEPYPAGWWLRQWRGVVPDRPGCPTSTHRRCRDMQLRLALR